MAATGPATGVPATAERDWREALSRTLLRSIGWLHLAAIVVYLGLSRSPVYAAVMVALLFGGLQLLLATTGGHPRLRGIAFCVSVLVEVGALGAMMGWAPTVVLIGLLGTVFGGLLLGRIGAYAMPAGVLVLLLAGALAVQNGYRVDTHQYDLDDPRTWWRVAGMYTILVSVTAWALRVALRSLVDAQLGANVALDRARAELVEVERTRASRESAEAAVRDAQKLQTLAQFSGGIAHLLNNTLTVVRGAAEQLRHTRRREQTLEVARVVVDSVARAAETTRDLLVFSRREQPPARPVVLGRELRTLEPTLQQSLPENIQLIIDAAESSPVLAEPVRIRQLVLNLVLNARDAITAEGRITLSARRVFVDAPDEVPTLEPLAPGPYLALTVADTGHGMDAPVQSRACEPFFTTRDPSTHDGLGLFVVFGLARQWGGSLRLESAAGEGTRVTVFLPVVSDEPGALESGAGASVPAPPPGADSRRASSRPAPFAPMAAPPLQLDAWKEPSLTRALFVVLLAFGAATALQLLLGSVSDRTTLVGAIVATLAVAAAWRARQAPLGVRFGVLVASICVHVSVAIVLNGYLTAAAVTGQATVVLLTAVYLGRLGPPLAVAVTVAPFVVGTFGPIGGHWQDGNVDPDVPGNWVRLALLMPVVYLVSARFVLDLLDTVTRSIEAREASLQRLLEVRRQREAEGAALKQVQAVASQVARLEAAGRVAGTVAHDLNNALGAVLGWASLLADDPDAPEQDVDDAIRAFDESVDFASTLVLQLQPHAAAAGPPGTATDVGALLSRSRVLLRRLLGDSIQLELEVTAGCHAPIAESELHRILFNLANNARDAMPNGGRLTVRCALDPEARAVRVEVCDTGMGMDEATRQRVFDAFFTTKGPNKGTGLGLHAVRLAVTDSGGEITVSSEPGHGSDFVLRWPLVDAPAPRSPPARPLTAAHRGWVLLAEDNAWVRSAFARGLERAGFDVVVAEDGTQALEQMSRRDDWVALCTDAIMPGQPSADVIRAFRGRFPERPIVVCSGHLPSDVERIVQTDGVRVLTKPIGPSGLVGALGEALAARGPRRD